MMVIGKWHIWFQRFGLHYAWSVTNKLYLYHFICKIANNFNISYAVGFPCFDNVLENLLCILLNGKQLYDLFCTVELGFHLRCFLSIFDIADSDAESRNVVAVCMNTLRQDGAFRHIAFQHMQIHRMLNPLAAIKGFLHFNLCGSFCFLYWLHFFDNPHMDWTGLYYFC